MRIRKRPAVVIMTTALLFCVGIVLSTGSAHALIYGDDERIEVEMVISLPDFGIFEAHIALMDQGIIEWSDPFPGPEGDVIEWDLADIEFAGLLSETGADRIYVFPDACLAGGCLTEWEPSPDFPAESFFDVYFQIELPDLLPGEILHTETPMFVSSFVTQWPPYYEVYQSDPAVPIPIFNEGGIVVGEILSWRQEHIPYYPPTAHINVPTEKYSNIALTTEEFSPFVEVSANLITNVPHEISHAVFSWRLAGTPDPFVEFGIDTDGSAPQYSTVKDMGTGDGWSALFDTNVLPPEETEVELQVDFFPKLLPAGKYGDGATVFVGSFSPDFFEFERDSIGYFRPDSIHAIPVLFYNDWIAFRELRVLPLVPDFHRTLVPIDQLGLGTRLDSVSCGPTAAASCLKYWTDNGYPEIEHPNGDTSKPQMTPEQIARELQGLMGTDSTGTSDADIADGIEDYLGNHGLDGWSVDGGYINDAEGLARMFEEFEADSEDVIILMADTTAAGDTIGHAVTMGSKTSSFYEVITDELMIGCIRHNVDFMDPWGGGSTADNEYPVDYDANGRPTTGGYSLGGAGNAWIDGYIKVSPPEDGGGGGGSLQALKLSDAWITVDGGPPATPPGIPDTLYWNTAGFEGGVYLMELRTTTPSGLLRRVIRLCGIPEYNTDTGGLETPGTRTMLRSSYPNPFNPTTTIEYSLARKGRVTITVYDIAGRLVKRLLTGELVEAGDHQVHWDGTNENGVRVASGVYFCSMKTVDEVAGIKLILLR
jgi:hypothetical protein